MNTREQFGKYLLLKKLTEDPLGETFRAGMLGSKGMERVALLRIFNGQGVDGGRLWQATRERAAIQQILRSPNIGEGVEMGELQGIPYVAYDYVSGKNMATLLETANKKQNYVPAEHALLIAERVALALAVACENRHGGDRILHGFLTPHLVMISNEGETRVLGFEMGPGLRGFATNPVIRQHFGRYLAPEAAAGQPLDRSDDIWSLGVLLFELLTSKPLPPADAGGYAAVIDGATLATEGTPIPADLAQLLKQSLVPRDQRIKDVATWHKTLNKWMFDGQYNPTTFNLAFYMHNLFRQEIEKESQEIEVEKTMPVPTHTPEPAPAPAAPEPPRAPSATPGVSEATENFIPDYAKDDKSSSNLGMILAIVAFLAIAVVGGFLFLGKGGGDATSEQPAQAAATPAQEGPTQAEIEARQQQMLQEQIRKLVEERSASMEEELRSQYDDQLAQLEGELNAAKTAAEKAAAEKALRAKEAERARAAEEARLKAEEEARAIAEEEARLKAEEEARLAAEEEARLKAEEEARLAANTPPVVAPPVVAPPPPAAAAEPQVRIGDLVELGDPGVVPPKMTKKPQPRFPQVALRMGRNAATVKVRVLVDENGKVIETEVENKAGFGFDAEAINAARKAGFQPATKDGVPVKVWHTLKIDFRR